MYHVSDQEWEFGGPESGLFKDKYDPNVSYMGKSGSLP